MDEHPFGICEDSVEECLSLCRRGPELAQQMTFDRAVARDIVLVALIEPLQERLGGEPSALGEITRLMGEDQVPDLVMLKIVRGITWSTWTAPESKGSPQ
jgi:hypothetical protein